MKKFNDYENTEVRNSEFQERIELGGHICKIIGVSIGTFKDKNGIEQEQLIIKFDFDSNDKQPGLLMKNYKEDLEKNKDAKYKGFHRIRIPDDTSEKFIKEIFATFIQSGIEQSNPGYTWNWEENSLIGKVFGGIFALEEFVANDGKTITSRKIAFINNIKNIANAKIPKVKTLKNGYVDYDTYIKQFQNSTDKQITSNNQSSDLSASGFFDDGIVTGDDLPF